MGRHTTPGVSAPGPRDEFVGWGAFSTGIAAVLVGVFAGWLEGVGVLVLGALTTGALWVARNHADAGLGRGRHASDTPWSPSDLLELKDVAADGHGPRRTEEPVRRRAGAASDAARGSRAGRSRTAAAGGAGPEPGADPPIGWLPGTTRSDPVAEAGDRSAVQPDPAVPHAWTTPHASLEPPDGTPPVDLGPIAVRGVAGGHLSAAPSPSPGRRQAGSPDDVVPATAHAAAAVAVAVADGRLPRVPDSRRSRRAADAAGGPMSSVLPVAPFGVPGPAVPAATATQPTRNGEAPASQVVGPERAAAPTPLLRVPVQPTTPDALSSPISPDRLASEPAVLDPTLDSHRAVAGAPVVLGPTAVTTAPARAATPYVAPDGAPAPGPAPGPAPTHAPTPAPETAPRTEPAPARRVGGDRDAAAAAIDPLWARRARRPERPRGTQARPAGLRREPAPVDRAAEPQWQPVPPDRLRQHDRRRQQLPPQREEAVAVEPGRAGPPDPDVPDVLLLPATVGPSVRAAGGPADDALAPPDAGELAPRPEVPASRPAPGTVSLDELLVLHTRRPTLRRIGSGDQAGQGTEPRLE